MKQFTLNKPRTHAEIVAMPAIKQHFEKTARGLVLVTDFNGFTPTSVGITGQSLKNPPNPFRTNNRKRSNGRGANLRNVQQVPMYKRDADGNLPVDASGEEQKILVGYRPIKHLPAFVQRANAIALGRQGGKDAA